MSRPAVASLRSGRQHATALLQALLVTFLWSTSWVLVKVGLDELDLAPISFAGLRYALAAMVLLPFGIKALRAAGAPPSRGTVAGVAGYGLLFVTLAQGAQFSALAVLPATAVSLILSSIPAVVAVLAIAGGTERPTLGQAGGIGVLTIGALLYFGPFEVEPGAGIGFAAAGVCVLAAALSSHAGRELARGGLATIGGPVGLTSISMVAGGAALLVIGLLVEGWPALDPRGWAIVAWLAIVNTAFAFTLWNHTLRTLTAVESSVVNNTMTVQIAVLAVVFLGEQLGPLQLAGLLLAAIGAGIVQLAPVVAGRRTERSDADLATPEPLP